jgi:hypothetical protein
MYAGWKAKVLVSLYPLQPRPVVTILPLLCSRCGLGLGWAFITAAFGAFYSESKAHLLVNGGFKQAMLGKIYPNFSPS